MKIAIIPARAGSKRIPRKNIRLFGGQPMISWSIKAAQDSGLFDEIIISTDDVEIADIAKDLGASVPFIRPEEISGDHTPIKEVVTHAIKAFTAENQEPELVCCIFATAPFIQQSDLISALDKVQDENTSFSFPIARFSASIQRAIKLDDAGHAGMFTPEAFNSRSQDLEPAYFDAGQFYWGRTQAWLQPHVMFSDISSPIVIPAFRVQDIDSEDDWTRAEYLFKALHASA